MRNCREFPKHGIRAKPTDSECCRVRNEMRLHALPIAPEQYTEGFIVAIRQISNIQSRKEGIKPCSQVT